MTKITKQDLLDRIEQYYKEFNFVPLPYQEDAILQGIYNYFTTVKGWSHIMGILGEYHFEKPRIDEEKRSYYSDRNNVFIINFDVGLWKTITSIILAFLIQDLTQEIIRREIEMFHTNKKKYLESIKTPFGKIAEKRLHEVIEAEIIQHDTKSLLPIKIVARKSILGEFQMLLKKKERNIVYYPSGRGIERNEGPLWKFSRHLIRLFFINHRDKLSTDSDFTGNEKSYKVGDIFIVDEWGTDPIFFWNAQLAASYDRYDYNKNYIIGLTANAEIKNTRNSLRVQTPRWMKSDPKIKEQLVKGKLYSGKDFLYRLVKIKNNEILQAYNKYKESQKKQFQNVEEQIAQLRRERSYLVEQINTLLDTEDPSTLDTIIERIEALKKSTTEKSVVKSTYSIIEKNKEILERQINRLNSSLRENSIDVFHQAGLSYLLEKNTILVLDDAFTDEKIQEIKESFREMEFTPVSALAAKNVSTPGHILIAKKEEIVRGLNLQHFDAILFAYVDSLTLEEIYQGVGRLDRIGNQTDKEIIFLGHSVAPDFVEKVLESKNKYTGSLSLSTISRLQELEPQEVAFLKEIREYNVTEEEKLVLKEMVLQLDKDSDKKAIEEKLKFIKKHVNEFKKLIRDIDQNVRRAIDTANKLSGKTADFEEAYLDNVLSIF